MIINNKKLVFLNENPITKEDRIFAEVIELKFRLFKKVEFKKKEKLENN